MHTLNTMGLCHPYLTAKKCSFLLQNTSGLNVDFETKYKYYVVISILIIMFLLVVIEKALSVDRCSIFTNY